MIFRRTLSIETHRLCSCFIQMRILGFYERTNVWHIWILVFCCMGFGRNVLLFFIAILRIISLVVDVWWVVMLCEIFDHFKVIVSNVDVFFKTLKYNIFISSSNHIFCFGCFFVKPYNFCCLFNFHIFPYHMLTVWWQLLVNWVHQHLTCCPNLFIEM